MRKLRQGGSGDILRSHGQPESGEPGLPCCDRSVHALPSGKGMGRERRGTSQGPEVCLLGEDIPSLPVTSPLVRVRVAWKRNAFSFLSGTLTFPSILLVETDAQGSCDGCIQGLPRPPGAHRPVPFWARHCGQGCPQTYPGSLRLLAAGSGLCPVSQVPARQETWMSQAPVFSPPRQAGCPKARNRPAVLWPTVAAGACLPEPSSRPSDRELLARSWSPRALVSP